VEAHRLTTSWVISGRIPEGERGIHEQRVHESIYARHKQPGGSSGWLELLGHGLKDFKWRKEEDIRLSHGGANTQHDWDLRNWLFRWGDGIRIESPLELRHLHWNSAQAVVDLYTRRP
jgi:hypothetical protein